MPSISKTARSLLPWLALALAALGGAALRSAVLERLCPRDFSYFIESCFRFRYAEMRMLGREVPRLDRWGQWPEGFAVDRMILPLPDETAALVYKLRGRGPGDTFLASRATIIIFSSLAVVAFAPVALAVFREPWPAAGATVVYAGFFGAFSRSVGNYLREDFAMPGLLVATAGVVYILTGAAGRRRWLAAAAAAAAAFWAGSSWHMSQFYFAVVALLVLAFAARGKPGEAALAGGALGFGLAVAALANKPLWVKGAMWNVSAALALAPAAGWALAKILRREKSGRWFVLGAAAVLAGASLSLGRGQDYGHVFALLWAKAAHFGVKPEPAKLSPEARLFWVGPYNSPGRPNLVMEYGLLAFPAAAGLAFLYYDVVKRRRPFPGAAFAALATAAFLVLYLLMARLTVFLAPWAAICCIYPAARAPGAKARAAWLAPLALLWLVQFNGATGVWRPPWFNAAARAALKPPVEVAWFYGSERDELLTWLAAAPRPSPVLADFSVSPPVLYLASQPTALNPMFEVPEVRRKAMAYAAAAASDEATFYGLCRRWRVRYVVHFGPQVLDHGGGSFYNATGVEPAPGSAAWLMQFQPERLRRLRLVAETYTTRTFEVGRPYDGWRAPAYHPLFDAGRFGAIPPEDELMAFYRELARAQTFYMQGVMAQEARDWGRAVAAFTSALRLHPDYEDANLRLGMCYMALGQRDEARVWLDRAARTRLGDPRPAAYLATLTRGY